MAHTLYNGNPLGTGINDVESTLTTSHSGTYIDNADAHLQSQIDKLKGKMEFIGMMVTTTQPEDPIQPSLMTELTDFNMNAKGRSPEQGDVVNVEYNNNIYGAAYYTSSGWVWYSKGANIQDASFTEKGVVQIDINGGLEMKNELLKMRNPIKEVTMAEYEQEKATLPPAEFNANLYAITDDSEVAKIIDDDNVSTTTTYSSKKINELVTQLMNIINALQ